MESPKLCIIVDIVDIINIIILFSFRPSKPLISTQKQGLIFLIIFRTSCYQPTITCPYPRHNNVHVNATNGKSIGTLIHV